jgi:hypothetical protein
MEVEISEQVDLCSHGQIPLQPQPYGFVHYQELQGFCGFPVIDHI